MSDMRITLPGSEAYTLTGQAIDKLIRAGDGDAALLYLYILRTHGKSTETETAIALDKSKGWVASAMALLSRLGLVRLDDADAKEVATRAASASAIPASTISASTTPASAISADPIKEPKNYTEAEVIHEIATGSEFSIVVDETQRRLGKVLSADELLRLFGIYDNLRLPAEVILQLITHCINECRTTGDGRAPSVRYIEKAAYTWEREGVFTLEKAEVYLKTLEERRSARGKMKKVLCIRSRELSATEKRYVDGWIEMGFEPEAVAIAYDKTVTKTGSLSWPYIDTIIKNWHNKGLHTAAQVMDNDAGQRRSNDGQRTRQGVQKYGEPNQEEMQRMQRLLSRVKGEE